ncbi:MAG TPA: ribosome small subunit-dependent GTPase A [Acidobacteriota bacterium]|nr:ribosome small subunit-dependent GTPase A [Acidobacteriota bacterium]HNT18008.1 ribosome small subunit-dependent GTPase A [Acidobacteriota bacterium]HPA26631.1 ribosome small subunit-dependent GTPase A [Acidobacteriota bacterium]HQO19481.1 ribosome small subunit-dependent GTPase A [Acidobacteriota bacterium]HQQ45987.1 ribosome small subunit-dependent GTPase A [Acidobacteriota bacterium]
MAEFRIVRLCGKKHWVWDGKETFPAFPAGRFELSSKNMKNRLSVGDIVNIRTSAKGEHLITELRPRKNKLSRRITFTGKEHVIAANIDEAAVVAAPNPVLKRGIIDRFLVACNAQRINLSIVVNKADLLEDEEAEEISAPYLKMGIKVFFTSVLNDTGFEELSERFRDKWVLLVGHSGVGKSSIANILSPEAELPVGEVYEGTLKGKHVTTSSTAVRLGGGGFLIDTAGLREFALFDVTQSQIQSAFPEIESLSATCKYSTCTHRREPACSVISALEDGGLDPEEYQSYLTLMAEATDIVDG